MASHLSLVPAERLQAHLLRKIASSGAPAIYVSFNKPRPAVLSALTQAGIDARGIFIIDCCSEGDMCIPPDRLDLLSVALEESMKHLPRPGMIFIDAIATLLLYNHVVRIAKSIRHLLVQAERAGLEVFAFNPRMSDSDLTAVIYNFFDECEELR